MGRYHHDSSHGIALHFAGVVGFQQIVHVAHAFVQLEARVVQCSLGVGGSQIDSDQLAVWAAELPEATRYGYKAAAHEHYKEEDSIGVSQSHEETNDVTD